MKMQHFKTFSAASELRKRQFEAETAHEVRFCHVQLAVHLYRLRPKCEGISWPWPQKIGPEAVSPLFWHQKVLEMRPKSSKIRCFMAFPSRNRGRNSLRAVYADMATTGKALPMVCASVARLRMP